MTGWVLFCTCPNISKGYWPEEANQSNQPCLLSVDLVLRQQESIFFV
ncbi:hypothetical protein A73_262 [Escherichia phage A73]|uniref:Uncharacterized protein n=1 Tax=Escherichia phage A73 TaxID=3003819 RepID=A0AAE9VXB1_9CAUD|nr:hypothetical protein A73_262 [Escherichia phage A73]